MIELVAEFRFYCKVCRTHTFTKFENIEKDTPNHAGLLGGYFVGTCGCGERREIWLKIKESYETPLPPRREPELAETLKKAKETLI